MKTIERKERATRVHADHSNAGGRKAHGGGDPSSRGDSGQTAKRLATAFYGRTSKDDPRRVTIEIQQTGLREWGTRDPLVSGIIGEYWDDGVTGKLPLWDRPEGKRLLEDIQAGKIESVAVFYADRFGRTLLDGLQAVKRLEEMGIKLVAVNDGWDSRRNDSPLYFQFRMMMAEEEHRRINERMRDGKRRAMERDNAPLGGPLTFGYRIDSRGQFVIDPVEGPTVIRIFEMALTGQSIAAIARWAQGTGARAGRKHQKRFPGAEPTVNRGHQNARWLPSKVRRILTNRTYSGECKWGGRVFPCPPLVDKSTFDKIAGVLSKRVRGPREKMPAKALVGGVLRCAHCGARYYFMPRVVRRGGKRHLYPSYVCHTMRQRWGACTGKLIRADQLDRDVWGLIEKLANEPEETLHDILAADQSLGGEVADLESLERFHNAELEKLDTSAAQIWEQQKANDWPMSWVAPKLNELNNRREQANKALADLRTRRVATLTDREQVRAVAARWAAFRKCIAADDLTLDERAEIVRQFIAGGIVRTTTTGRRKSAEVRLEIVWHKEVKMLSPKNTKDSSFV